MNCTCGLTSGCEVCRPTWPVNYDPVVVLYGHYYFPRETLEEEELALVRQLAVEKICPYTKKPETPYEHDAVKSYEEFGREVLRAARALRESEG